jgi:hypothetical protein
MGCDERVLASRHVRARYPCLARAEKLLDEDDDGRMIVWDWAYYRDTLLDRSPVVPTRHSEHSCLTISPTTFRVHGLLVNAEL